jgi:3-oxoacyl-[acyl-carrier protein] reductase
MADAPVTIVTGAASGIGRELASVLAARGHRLLAVDVDQDGLEAHAAHAGWPAERVLRRRLDVRDPEAWTETIDLAFRTWGRLDTLLNVAGVLRPSSIHTVAAADVDFHLDVNTKGVIHGTRAAAARMVPQGHGHIVNVASLAAHCPVPGLALYAASKFAVRGFSLSAAYELAPLGVAVSVVCPDAVATPMLDLQLQYPEAALTFSGGRTLTVGDVARVVVDRVLVKKPIEVILPASRGVVARAVGLVPGLARRFGPLFQARGRARQQALLRARTPKA